jgi:hypothetical protein
MNVKTNKPNWREVEAAKQKRHKQVVLVLDVIMGLTIMGHVWLDINIVQKLLLMDRDYVYNCTVADIHPAFTPAMRETCQQQFKKETK